jgi:GT2 family glycosyltransferase
MSFQSQRILTKSNPLMILNNDMVTSPNGPHLSIIIASYNSRNTIGRCLESLRSQKTHGTFETIVVDTSTDGTAAIVKKRFPEVRLYNFSERKFCGDARNWGISVAKGEIIAFIDADCVADSRWVDEILKAHQFMVLAVGGAIANGEPSNLVGWASYFCEFSQWMPTTPATWFTDVAGANMSYKKEIFDRYGFFIEGTYCSDTDLHWRLGRDGYRLRFIPSMLVSHKSIDRLDRFLKHEFFHGRCFAEVRIQGQGFSRRKRFLYVTFSPLIPLRLLFKIGLNNRRNKIYLSHFLKSLPLVALGLICWSLGEAVGYAGG